MSLKISLSALASQRDGREIFKPLSFNSTEPTALEITGANGAGKTTLLRTLAGIHGQFSGEFVLPRALYQGHRAGLDELMTVVDNLHWFARVRGLQLSDDVLREALARVDMYKYAFMPVGQLSQGQQRRVGMARWLLSDAQVWLLDEPLAALDPSGQRLLVELLMSHIEAGGAVLYTTHVELDIPDKESLFVEAMSALDHMEALA